MTPNKIYYEPEVMDYRLGTILKKKYPDLPWIPIKSHNNIEELRTRENKDFARMKQYLIVGIRKTHKYNENFKVSDYLVPFTSSGCSAMCLYCYLVCNYNKCSYLRVYANRDEIMKTLIRRSYKTENLCTFEIGSNSDLILENEVTGYLPSVIEEFAAEGRGSLTFPTKFSMVKSLLHLDHKGKTIFRMSVNPREIIALAEIGTSSLIHRVEAINAMCEAGYPVGLLIAPVIMVENWTLMYRELLDYLHDHLSIKVKKTMFIEVIFMTYSYVHRAINDQAFPNALKLYNKELMTGRGRGKYCYKKEYREEAEEYLREEIGKRFDADKIVYVV